MDDPGGQAKGDSPAERAVEAAVQLCSESFTLGEDAMPLLGLGVRACVPGVLCVRVTDRMGGRGDGRGAAGCRCVWSKKQDASLD